MGDGLRIAELRIPWENALPFSILQRYVLRETFRVVAISLLALTAIIFVGVSVEMVREGLSIVQLRSILPFILAYSLPFAMPASFLVGSVFSFGRMSGQNELSAMRASGIGLHHVIWPLVVSASLVCAGTFWLNHYLFPWSLGHVRNMTQGLISQAIKYVGRSFTKYEQGDLLIYVGGLTPDRKFWKDVAVIQFAHEYPARVLLAERGHCHLEEDNSVAVISLYNGKAYQPQLGERIGTPVMAFDGMRYRVKLGSEKKVPTVGLAPSEARLIRECVSYAAKHAGSLTAREEIGRYLLFAGESPDPLSWRHVGLVEFDASAVPTRVLVAQAAHLVPATGRSSATLDLRNGREVPVHRGKLRENEAIPFAEITLDPSAGAPEALPVEGTRPEELWFETRPKYLALPDLLDARRALRRAADALRSDPRWTRVVHPRTRRVLIEKEEAKLHAVMAERRIRLAPFRNAVDDASAAVERANEALQQATDRIEVLARQIAEVQRSRDEAAARRDMLRAEIERTTGSEGDQERVARLRASLGQSEKEVESLSGEMKRLSGELEAQRARCEDLKAEVEKSRATLEAARKRLGEAEASAEEARRRYEQARAEVRDLKVMERLLRADSEFHYRNAGAATCLVFVLIGIPLGILSRRGNVIMAFAISFFTVIIVYYPLLIVGEMLARDGFVVPWLAEWMANIVVGIAGAVLLYITARG